jgi:hypothetical protein
MCIYAHMKTKTWKIGEYAFGGIITIEIKNDIISIIGKEWDYSKGSNKGSDQSNAKEFTRGSVSITDYDCNRKLFAFLNHLTTSYYADEIIKWIESKTELKRLQY